MKELREFKKLIEEQELNPNDYGGVTNLGGKDYRDQLSFLEKSFMEIESDLMAQGKSESSAKSLVSKALDELIKTGAVDELPEEGAPDGVKMRWISVTRPRVREYLVQVGDLLF